MGKDSGSESSGRDEYGIKVDPLDVKDFGADAEVNRRKREKEDRKKRRARSSSSSDDGHGHKARRKHRRRRRSRSRSRDKSRKRRRSRDRSNDRSKKDRSASGSRSTSPIILKKKDSKKVRKRKEYWAWRNNNKFSFWDIAPEGFEHVAPKQYKEMQATGQVAVQSIGSHISGNIDEIKAGGSKNNRTYLSLYVGGLPFGATEQTVFEFFNAQMRAAKLNDKTKAPIQAVRINMDKNFAFLEFKERSECTNALAFDGVEFRGAPLKIRRPLDYNPPSDDEDMALPQIHVKGIVSNFVKDSVNKIFIGGLPNYMNDEQVKELLEAFGPLRGFSLVKDSTTGFSKGFGFAEYVDTSVTDMAIAALHGMEISERRLVVQRAELGVKGDPLSKHGPTPIQVPGLNLTVATKESLPTRVVCLINVVTLEELRDEEDYEDILDDMKDECAKYGRVKSIEIPRPIVGEEVGGLGKVYVEFAAVGDSIKATNSLSGRKFAQRVVMTCYYDEERFQLRDFE